MELTTKRSNFWYILPIIFGLLGGVIVYFVLRKSDPSKAKICFILGLGITVAYFVYFGSIDSSSTDDTPKLTEKSQESDIQAIRAVEEAKYQAELERQRAAEEAKYQAELERQRVKELLEEPYEPKIQQQTTQFDPIIVKSSLENIPKLQGLPKEILKQCRSVNSYSDYNTFALAVMLAEPSPAEVLNGVRAMLNVLESQGYDDHDEIGSLIDETRQILSDSDACILKIVAQYG